MKTLQDKINDITKEHNFKIFADKISNGIKHQAILSIYGDFISFDCKTLEEAKYLLETLKPINKNTIIGTATDSFYKVINTPYRIDIINPAVINNYNNFTLKIQYIIDQCKIWIYIPLKLVPHEFKKIERKITSCENHYFPGYSQRRLDNMKIIAYTFNNNYVINFYGGGKTLVCEIEIENIINSILR